MINHRLDKVANSDLVALLAKELSCKVFSFHKVKSHRQARLLTMKICGLLSAIIWLMLLVRCH